MNKSLFLLLIFCFFVQIGQSNNPFLPPVEDCQLYIPNVFSPNGDGRNDSFRPETACVLNNFELKIFDRWGRLLFQSENPEKGWDGTVNGEIQPNGSYVYLIQTSFLDGDQGNPIIRSGAVTLLR